MLGDQRVEAAELEPPRWLGQPQGVTVLEGCGVDGGCAACLAANMVATVAVNFMQGAVPC